MRREFLHGVKRADANVEDKPGKQEPAGPIVANQQEDATKDGKQTNCGNKKEVLVERAIFEVIEETDRSCKDEQAPENNDWQRTFHIVKAKILRGDDAAFNILRIK